MRANCERASIAALYSATNRIIRNMRGTGHVLCTVAARPSATWGSLIEVRAERPLSLSK